MQPLQKQKSHNLSKKNTQPFRKKIITQPPEKKEKSGNRSELVSEKNHANSPHTKIMQPLHAQNHPTSFF